MKCLLSVPLLSFLALSSGGGCSDDPATTDDAAAGSTAGVTGTVTTDSTASTSGASTTTVGGTSSTATASTTNASGSTGQSVSNATAATGTATTGEPVTSTGMGGGTTTTGTTGATGAGGATSTTGTSTTGSMPAAGSSGCGLPASQELGQWVSQGGDREWAIRLPDNYDPERAYPLVVLLHGCTSGTNNVPVERESGEDAIVVRGTGSGSNTCWDYQADLPFFDSMVEGVKEAACVDENRVFAAGYSSGAWFISLLACVRGDVLRAAGTVAGGNARGNGACTGSIAQIFIHALDDTENYWDNGQQSSHINAMQALVEANGCTPDSAVPEAPEPCERYQGCGDNPVKVCNPTTGGHGRQDDFAAAAFWQFFSEF